MQAVADEFRLVGVFADWNLQLRIERHDVGFYLHVSLLADDSDTGEMKRFEHSAPYFYFPDRDQLRDLIVARIRTVVVHELGEVLWFKDTRPIYPHHNS